MKQVIYSARSNNPQPSMIAIGDVIDMIGELTADKRVVVITDQNLLKLYPEIISQYPYIVIGCGEANKNLATVENIHRELLAMEADRGTYLIGFGGGIVTDITGFAASTYMRGIGFGFVATSLLAQVDASVGGKNGVNLDGYKNIIGTFNQPDFVLCDTNILATLPERELRAGMSEALKCGIIGDVELFDIFASRTFEEIVSDKELLTQVVSRSVRLKAEIVSQDEREGGVRKLLNLGHTFAHAIEKRSNQYIHGEAVAIGMGIITRISSRINNLSQTEAMQIVSAINKLSLPDSTTAVPFSQLLETARADKKRSGNDIELILIDRIGKCRISKMAITELQKMTLDE